MAREYCSFLADAPPGSVSFVTQPGGDESLAGLGRLPRSRRSRMRRALGWLLVALSLSVLGALSGSAFGEKASAQAAATVTVKIDGFKGTEGVALVVLYDSAESWLKIPKAAQVAHAKITGSALTVEL